MNEIAKVHVFYVVSMLIAVIVGLLSFRIADVPKMTDYISVAANLTSLVLAILAIVYAFFSNFSLSQTLAEFTNVALRISDAASGVAQSSIEAKQSSEALAGRTQELVGVSEKISGGLSDLAAVAHSVEQTSAALRGHVDQIPVMVGDLKAKLEQAELLSKSAAPEAAPSANVHQRILRDNDLGRTFMKASSLHGLLLLYACVRATDGKKPVSLSKLESFSSVMSMEYAGGFSVAATAAGLIEKKGSSYQNFSVTDVNVAIRSGIKEELMARLERDAFKTKKADYSELIGKIDAEFPPTG